MATNIIQVGALSPSKSLSPAQNIISRAGNMGDSIVSSLHGDNYEAAYNKSLFTAYAAGTVLSAAGTAMTGLMIYNPSTTVNLCLKKYCAMVSVTSASMTGVALGVGTGQTTAPTGQTAITKVSCNYLGQSTPQGLALNAGTFTVAPTAQWLLFHNTAAIATTGVDQMIYDLEEGIIIPPYGYAAFVALGAASAAAAFTASLTWNEVPV